MHTDRITGFVLLALCTVVWFFIIPRYVPGDVQQIFPRVVLVFIAIPSLVMCLRAAASTKKTLPADERVLVSRRKAFIKTCVMGGAYLAYLLFIPVAGFFLASLAATVGFFLFLGIRNIQTLTLVPLVMLIVIHVVIERFLKFELPSGLLF